MVTSESLQQAFRYLFIDEVKALKDLARSLPPNPIVCNIGAGSGTSGLAFMESRPDLTLITIDVQYADSPLGCILAEQMALEGAGLLDWNRYIQLHKPSQSTGELWQTHVIDEYKLVDLVFVDGLHSYNGCKGDILSWLPNIKPGGIMAVHDFNKREVYKDGPIEGAPHPLPWPGVDRAVRKFLCPRYEIILQVATLIAFRII